MRGFSAGLVVAGALWLGLVACSSGKNGGEDDDEKGGAGSGAGSGSGGSTGGAGGATGGSGASDGSGGASAAGGSGGAGTTGGSGGSAAGTSGASGKGGGAGAGPQPCDTSGLEWEDPGCPAGTLRTFADPICSEFFKCVVGTACAGLACDSCIETVAYAYAMDDVCISGITEAELREVCLSYAAEDPACTPVQ